MLMTLFVVAMAMILMGTDYGWNLPMVVEVTHLLQIVIAVIAVVEVVEVEVFLDVLITEFW